MNSTYWCPVRILNQRPYGSDLRRDDLTVMELATLELSSTDVTPSRWRTRRLFRVVCRADDCEYAGICKEFPDGTLTTMRRVGKMCISSKQEAEIDTQDSKQECEQLTLDTLTD